MKFSELRELTVEDIDLILKDQQELYSQDELDEIKEYREYLLEQERIRQESEKREGRLRVVVCPKCDGSNDAGNSKCIYCDYQFKESDYYAKENTSSEKNEVDSEAINAPIGRLLFGLLFSGGGVGSIIYGHSLNNNMEAQWEYFWETGSKDPGTTWIIIGAAAAVLGGFMLMSAFSSKD